MPETINQTTLKSIQALRKTLVEAQRSAILATDDIEDMSYMNDPAVQSLGNETLTKAASLMAEISDCVTKAVELTEQVKSAFRGGLIEPAISDEVQETVRSMYARPYMYPNKSIKAKLKAILKAKIKQRIAK